VSGKVVVTDKENYVFVEGILCERNPKNGLVKLPRQGAGYKTYRYNVGLTWGTEYTISCLLSVARLWSTVYPEIPIQIGDLSTRDGGNSGRHSSHNKGSDVDILPVSNNPNRIGITWRDRDYSLDKTSYLVELVLRYDVSVIYFNDVSIKAARPMSGHDNHLHIGFKR
jgi:murein endopeptidase